jgi:uncharacterized protein (UPF0332 family)
MLSRETEQRVQRHLRLARGFLETAVARAESSEFDQRNALSRAYYASFHAFSALLLSREVEPSKSHGRLQDQVRRWLGRAFGHFLRDAYESRRFADYDPSWSPIGYNSESKLRMARTNVLWTCLEAEKKLK